MGWSSRRNNFGLTRGWQPAGGSFNPASFGTVLAYWDFTDPATLSLSGSRITAITDKSGNGKTLSEVSSSGPDIATFGSTGKNGASFNGTSNYLSLTPGTYFTPIHNNGGVGGTVVAWALRDATSLTKPLIELGAWSPGTEKGVGIWAVGATPTYATVDSTNNSRSITTGTIVAGTPFVFTGMHTAAAGASAATVKIRFNSSATQTSAGFTASSADSTGFKVGSNNNAGVPNNWWNGDIARIVIYSGVLSDAVVAQVEAGIVQ